MNVLHILIFGFFRLFLFLARGVQRLDVGSQSQTRDGTWASVVTSVRSEPVDPDPRELPSGRILPGKLTASTSPSN